MAFQVEQVVDRRVDSGEHWTKPVPPVAYRLMTYVDPAFVERGPLHSSMRDGIGHAS